MPNKASFVSALPIGVSLLLATTVGASGEQGDRATAHQTGKEAKMCSLLELTRQLSAEFPGEKLDVKLELDGGSHVYDVRISVVPR